MTHHFALPQGLDGPATRSDYPEIPRSSDQEEFVLDLQSIVLVLVLLGLTWGACFWEMFLDRR